MRAAGARDWSDDVEAASALLSAAGVLGLAPGQRRMMARELVRRRFSPSDLLTFLAHHLQRGRGGGWLCVVLRRDPEAVAKCRCKRRGIGGAVPLLAGTVDRRRQADAAELVAHVAARSRVAPMLVRTAADVQTRENIQRRFLDLVAAGSSPVAAGNELVAAARVASRFAELRLPPKLAPSALRMRHRLRLA